MAATTMFRVGSAYGSARRLRSYLWLVCLVVLFTTSVLAQRDLGTITGTV